MIAIPTSIVKRGPYVGPVVSGVKLALDVKNIIEIVTPLGAAKVIAKRLVNECTPPELLIAGKYVMLPGGVIASIVTSGNPLVVNSIVSVARSIVRG